MTLPKPHKVREMGLPSGPSTLKLIGLIVLTRTLFALYLRSSYDQDTLWYRGWCWCIRLKAYKDYKRYLVEAYVDRRYWWYLIKNMP